MRWIFYKWLFLFSALQFSANSSSAAEIDSALFNAVVCAFHSPVESADTVKKFIVSVNGQQVQQVSVLYDQTNVFYEDINAAFNGTIGFYSIIIENYIFGSLKLNPAYADISFSGKVLVQIRDELQQETSVRANDYFSLQLTQSESLIANTLAAITQYLSEDPSIALVFNYYLAGYTTDQDKNLIPFEYLHTDYSDLESFLIANFDSPPEISFQNEFKKRAAAFRESLAGDYYDAQRKDIVLQRQAEVSFACVVGVLFENELLDEVSYLDEFGSCDIEPMHRNAGSILRDHLSNYCTDVSLYSNDDKSIVSASREDPTSGVTEFQVEFTSAMTQDELFDMLLDWGIGNETYCFYRFGYEHNISTWLYWLDMFAMDDPPVMVALLSDLLMGPAGAVYGYYTGEHWRTGDELTGWDHVLNTLDFIPAVSTSADAIKFGISSLKCRQAGKILDMVALAERLPAQAFHFIRNLSAYGLRIAGEEINNMWIIIKSTGIKIGRIANGALSDLKILNSYQAELADIGKIPVQNSTGIVETELKLVKNGDEIGFATRILDEVIRGVTRAEFFSSVKEFADNPQLAEQAYQLWKNEQWSELEELINLHGMNQGWPPIWGFENVEIITMEVGETFDRYGGKMVDGKIDDTGFFGAPVDTPFENRALPDGFDKDPPRKYRVIKPIPDVKSGVATPWFNKPGKGLQYQFNETINELLEEEFIELIE